MGGSLYGESAHGWSLSDRSRVPEALKEILVPLATTTRPATVLGVRRCRLVKTDDESDAPTTARGAGDGDRTRIASLEGWSSAIELHPQGYEGASPSVEESTGSERSPPA